MKKKLLLVAALAALVTGCAPAAAQAPSDAERIAELERRVDELEREIFPIRFATYEDGYDDGEASASEHMAFVPNPCSGIPDHAYQEGASEEYKRGYDDGFADKWTEYCGPENP
ncbi:hypothetical protein KIK06_20200 [Nocardiopsis sp. EMB25]|uniref:hypothetical protein n=1 Tax=Nocardiopsis sp. EMB25 TaxID=2835867 RepID=UPI002285336A|nr:hypothetical protein [Nocardiopsis sp. EMB25]MCY9786219.1 hypothetical protein [Nocardiopsis sp. EMB25]